MDIQFCMKYKSTNDQPKDDDFKSIEYKKCDEGWNITDEMNLIVTDDFFESECHYSLPKYIEIKNPLPGELRYMRRRSRQVARFHKGNRTNNQHEYYYSELQLYSKFNNETELHPDNLDKCMTRNQSTTTCVKFKMSKQF